MTVRIKADEKVGRLSSEPYLAVYLERSAVLDRGLEAVESRAVNNIRLELGYVKPAQFNLHPRHLDRLIRLLEDARARLQDQPIEEQE